MSTENLLTTAQAAARKGVSLATVKVWCSRGKIPGARKIGPNWMIPEVSLADLPPKRPAGPASKNVQVRLTAEAAAWLQSQDSQSLTVSRMIESAALAAHSPTSEWDAVETASVEEAMERR